MQAENSPESGSISKWMLRRGVAETLACALAFLVFVPTLGFQFVYDDKPQVLENPAIHAWGYVPNYFTAHAWAELYPHVSGNYYRPLFLLWFRINHAIFGVNPTGWHLSTVLCHVAATYLVFALVRRLTTSQWMAPTASLLFALHPVHIESVAWVSGVTDPLMAVFLIGSLLAYLLFREGGQWKWMRGALILFALGLLVKETAVVLGPLVFAHAWLFAERTEWRARLSSALRSSLGFLALTLLYISIRARIIGGLGHSVTPLTLTTIGLTEPSIVWLYIRHMLFPVGLSGLYGLPYVTNPASAAFLVPAVLLLVFILAVAWGIHRLEDPRLALFACCWIALPILPVLWLRAYAEGDIAHDRYLYLPSIGFVLLVTLFIGEAAKYWRSNQMLWLRAGVAILALGFAAATVTQETYWASDLLLYQRAYTLAPHDNLICNNLGTALLDAGNPGQAIALYSQVLAREPGFWLSNYNLGYAYYRMGDFKQAESFLRRAIAINATDSDEYIYLGLSLWRQGRADEAVPCVQNAIQIRPSAQGYHFALAMIRRDQKDIAAARAELNLELHYHPESTAARQQLELLASGEAADSK